MAAADLLYAATGECLRAPYCVSIVFVPSVVLASKEPNQQAATLDFFSHIK